MTEPRNVLVVANEAIEGSEVTEAILEHLGGQTVRIYLVTPALVESALDHEMGQVDQAVAPARERLQRSVAELQKLGIEATGAVVDSDPVVAISDELQKFAADEIVLISHTDEDRAHAEKDLLEKVSHEFSQPITQLVVTRPGDAPGVDDAGHPGGDGDPHLVGVEQEGPGEEPHPPDVETSENLPPLRARAVAALVTGIVGSLALVVIAADCALGSTGGVSGVCAAKLLIALGALLINGAHTVALVFFESLRYEGPLARFVTTFTLTVTPTAVVVSLLL